MSPSAKPIRSRLLPVLRRGAIVACLAGVILSLLARHATDPSLAQESEDAGGRLPTAFLIPVPLPITGTIDTNIKRRIDQVLAELPGDASRPALILEFRVRSDRTGEGSEFERCLSLARFLASERLDAVRTVAYLPGSVKGHAVLPVLACEEFIIAPDAELGEAGIDETYIDPTIRRGYSEIAERRRTVPVAVALGMLDKELVVSRVQTLDGVRYVLSDELEQLKQEGTISSVESVVTAGDMARFTGRELRVKYGFASHLASDRRTLAEALQVPPDAIEEDPSLGGEWTAVRVDLAGVMNAKAINWIDRSIRQRLKGGKANFVCIVIDSPGGSPTDSLRLANYLAGLDASEVRTVAYVQSEARADASMIALACDHLVMGEEAIVGGPGAADIRRRDVAEMHRALKSLAEEKQRDASLMMALVDPSVTVHRYTREGTSEVRYFTSEELSAQDDPGAWQRGGEIETRDGLSGRAAEELGLARFLANDFAEFKQLYHLEDELESVEPNWAHLIIENLASPKIAGILLFVAWFALLMEFSQPGLGVAGFVSGLCFILYFWSQFMHGTAGWLEVTLFVAGVISVLVEIFVVPGLGIFGFGGGFLIIASIVLASQTFVIPRNTYQLEQMPGSLMTVACAGAGAFAALVVMRRFLPDAPVLKRLMLATPDEEEREELSRRESLVDYNYLVGKRGQTTTQLVPSGKARFGDEVLDVISDGEVVPPGTPVCVAEVMGNHIYVRPMEKEG